MEYRKVGKWGLRISELSLGSWLTFGKQMDLSEARKVMHAAYDAGINFFDTAEAYNSGVAEYIMGQVLKDFKREEIVVSTKIFWWNDKPNQTGLSKKHFVEGLYNSLKRLQLDYVDIVYCHRPDLETPLEETLFAIDYVLRQGMALYWGTSEWPADLLMKAHKLCKEMNCMPPIVEQPQYNMLVRERVEKEYAPLYKEEYGMGLTTWSPLASGILTGKYIDGIPENSRLATFPNLRKNLEEKGWLSEEMNEKLRKLKGIAKDLGGTLAQLAIAWILKNPNVSSVILGVTSTQQLEENLKSLEIKDKLSDDIMKEIEGILEG